jgi:hypothetical protein
LVEVTSAPAGQVTSVLLTLSVRGVASQVPKSSPLARELAARAADEVTPGPANRGG